MYNFCVPDLSVNLFGTPQIKRGNEQLSIQRRKDLALLIYLVSSSQPQSRDTLAALLWQDQTQTEARSNLRKSLSRLKSILGENALVVSQDQVEINPTLSVNLDTEQFNSHIHQFRQHGHRQKANGPYLCEACQDALEEAARLYGADFLQGFSVPDSPMFEEWQFFQAESLRKNLAEVLELLTLQLTFAGDHTQAIEHCRRWLALDRLHEPPNKQLMLLYALNGQQSAALRHFDEFARLLKDELDAEPEAETRQLHEAIQRKKLGEIFKEVGSGRLTNNSSALLQPAQKQIRNLPIYPTVFVGREKELQELFSILREDGCRLLTLLGPGGSGKTRLAVQAASIINTNSEWKFKDGIIFLPLAPVSDPAALTGALIEGLNIASHMKGTETRQQLLAHLSGRRMLLVIDNFEHLLGMESVQLISDILDAAPSSKILITSRERLNIRGEYLFRVEGLEAPHEEPPLSQPAPDSVISAFSALQLFEQCARRVLPSFQITQENYLPVAQICRTVQGMPLAIEMAASWLEIFSPEEIHVEITRSLDFLQSSWRDLPDRQRSLRAVFDSSWELLDDDTRLIVKALSIFRTSFTREAAQAVSGASPKALLDLTNKSWIQRLANGRYQIHELLRQFLYEKLSAEESTLEQVRTQYSEYYAGYAHLLWQAMKGAEQKRAYARTELEFENLQTAWMWLVAKNKQEFAVEHMLPVLLHYTELRGKTIELIGMLDAALRSLNGSKTNQEQKRVEIILQTAHRVFFQDGFPLRYSIHDAIFPTNLKNVQATWQQAKQSFELYELGFWGILLAYIYGRLSNLKEGVRQIKKIIPYFQKDNQRWELANAYLHLLKLMVPNRENPDDEVQVLSSYLSQAMDIFDALGDKINRGHILMLWGDLKFIQRDLRGAIEQWRTARTVYESVEEWGTATNAIWSLIDAYLQVGDFQKAYESCAEMAESYLQHGLRHFAVGVFSKESLEKSRHGDLADAMQIRQRCIDMIHESGPEYQFAWNYWEMGELVRLSGDLAGASNWFERAGPIFEREHDHVGISFYHRGMGDIALAQRDLKAARRYFTESVRHSRASNHTWMIAYAVNGLGRAELALGDDAAAEKHILEALRLAVKSADQGIILVVLAAYAALLYRKQNTEEAAQLASLVSGHILTWHETRKQATDLLAAWKPTSSNKKSANAEKRANSIDVWKLAKDLIESR